MIREKLRREIFKTFRQLHKTRKNVFEGDDHALEVARKKINEEYRKNKHLTNEVTISELNQFAKEVEHEMRTSILRAIEKRPGVFELQIRPDTPFVNNFELDKTCEKNKSPEGPKK